MNLVGCVRHLSDFTCSLYVVVGLQTIVGRALNARIVQVMGDTANNGDQLRAPTAKLLARHQITIAQMQCFDQLAQLTSTI